jgi:TonB family protein
MRVSIPLLLVTALPVLAETPPHRPPGEQLRAVAIYAPKPDYPLEARAHWMEGRGVFTLTVLPDGTVASVEITKSTGHHELDESAIAAFQNWRFKFPKPGMAPQVKIPIAFTLAGLRPPGIESALQAEKRGNPPPKRSASWQEYWQQCLPAWIGSHSEYADYFRKRRKALGLDEVTAQ